MNKQNNLYIEYARVIKMCKGTALEDKPWLGIKNTDPNVIFKTHPSFSRDPEDYQFAIAILEDRPVFPGDILYWKVSGVEYVANKYTTASIDNMTWQPPKPKRRIVLEEASSMFDCVIDGVFYRKIEDTGNKQP